MRLRGLVIAIAMLLLAAGLRSPHPAGAATTPQAYLQRIAAAISEVDGAQHRGGPARRRAVDAARALLSGIVTVRLGAVQVAADLGAALDDLNAERLTLVHARLAALVIALGAPSAHLTAPDRLRLASLDRILKSPPFISPPNLWTAIGDFLGRVVGSTPLGMVVDWLNRLLNAALASAAGSPIVAIVAGLIVAVALVFAAGRSFGTLVPRADMADGQSTPSHRLDAAGARARAARWEAQGDFREATRFTFLATLLTLDEAGHLRVDDATGNRDVLRQARTVPRLSERLAPVVRDFEMIWFGHLAVSREEYELYRRLNDHVLEATR